MTKVYADVEGDMCQRLRSAAKALRKQAGAELDQRKAERLRREAQARLDHADVLEARGINYTEEYTEE